MRKTAVGATFGTTDSFSSMLSDSAASWVLPAWCQPKPDKKQNSQAAVARHMRSQRSLAAEPPTHDHEEMDRSKIAGIALTMDGKPRAGISDVEAATTAPEDAQLTLETLLKQRAAAIRDGVSWTLDRPRIRDAQGSPTISGACLTTPR